MNSKEWAYGFKAGFDVLSQAGAVVLEILSTRVLPNAPTPSQKKKSPKC